MASSQVSPTDDSLFAAWAAGNNSSDPQIIHNHVHDVVEVVFKNYDLDKDDFISRTEFEAVANNFPITDPFEVIDADHDDMISKSEMETYFVASNNQALRECFKHEFQETTYFWPTFCLHCSGLLWGFNRQGWKCRDCSISAHKRCKDHVVMKCRIVN